MVSVAPSRCGTTSNAGAAAPSGCQAFEAAFANGRAFLRAARRAARARPRASSTGVATPSRSTTSSCPPTSASTTSTWCRASTCRRSSSTRRPARLFDGLLRVRMPAERLELVRRRRARRVGGAARARRVRVRRRARRSPSSEATTRRAELRATLLAARAWPEPCRPAWSALVRRRRERVGGAMAQAMTTSDDRLRLLWRLLRVGPTPYFVLGVGDRGAAAAARPHRRGTGPTATALESLRGVGGHGRAADSCCGTPTVRDRGRRPDRRRRRPRRDPVEPRAAQRRARGEGVPRHRRTRRSPATCFRTSAGDAAARRSPSWSGASCRSSRRPWARCPGPSWWRRSPAPAPWR